MNAFEAWNLRLLQTYFPLGGGGREVFLGTTPEELDRIGEDLGGDAGLLAAVAAGPPWPLPNSFVDKVRRLTEQRAVTRRRGPSYVDPRKYDPSYAPDGDVARSAPTYLPYLAVLARNAAVADKSGYYARLRADLGLPSNWGSSQMSRLVESWKDLQAWTTSTCGRYGTFVARQLGSHSWIGLPKAQVILSATDIPGIYRLFDQIGASPDEPLTAEQLARAMDAIGSGEQRLSRALEQAAGDASYAQELRALLEGIHQDWLGTVESFELWSGVGEGASLTFGIFADGHLPWRLQVGFELPEDAEIDDLSGGAGWRVSVRGDREAVATMDRGKTEEFLSRDDWSIDLVGQTYRLPRRGVWVLRRSMHGYAHEFWEGDLSPFGNLYLLADPTCAKPLDEYLYRSGPKYEDVPIDGLPDGWRLVWLEQQALSDDQLKLPGRNRKRPRVLRLEGGTTVSVHGSRQYLHYDLPRVVVMAPDVAYVECEGERMEPMTKVADEDRLLQGVCTPASDAYFNLPTAVETGGEFSLRVFDPDGKQLGEEVTIRVKDPDGVPRPLEGRPGGINRLGDFTYSDEALRGGLRLGSPNLASGLPIAAGQQLQMAGSDFHESREASLLEHNPSALFLDALHSRRRLSYGNAADLLVRLMAKTGADIKPWRVLDDLWLRGHLELERSNGTTTFVHSVPPAAYELPVRVDGKKVYGILGTLPTLQWRKLTGEQVAWIPSIGLAQSGGKAAQILLPVVRIRSFLEDVELSARLDSAGLEVLPEQSFAIAQWSASLSEILADAFTRASIDSPLTRPIGLKRFDTTSGYFHRTRGGMERPQLGDAEVLLYQYDDPHVRGKKMHILANRGGVAVARDVRWAKWVATMMAPLGKANPGKPPFVLRENGPAWELWVPGRLRLPPVLERAVVLCRGAPGVEMWLDAGQEDGHQVELIFEKSRQELGIHVDKDIAGGLVKGQWMLYENIPSSLGKMLRSKLRPS